MHYKELVDDALRGVVRQALTRVAESGLPGNHHLYVSFRSHYPGVLAPEHLRQKYPDEITIAELAEEIRVLTESTSPIVFHPLPSDDPKVRRPDITRARDLLGWEPRVDRREGLIETIEYFRQEQVRLGV